MTEELQQQMHVEQVAKHELQSGLAELRHSVDTAQGTAQPHRPAAGLRLGARRNGSTAPPSRQTESKLSCRAMPNGKPQEGAASADPTKLAPSRVARKKPSFSDRSALEMFVAARKSQQADQPDSTSHSRHGMAIGAELPSDPRSPFAADSANAEGR